MNTAFKVKEDPKNNTKKQDDHKNSDGPKSEYYLRNEGDPQNE